VVLASPGWLCAIGAWSGAGQAENGTDDISAVRSHFCTYRSDDPAWCASRKCDDHAGGLSNGSGARMDLAFDVRLFEPGAFEAAHLSKRDITKLQGGNCTARTTGFA